jgi:sterol 3beta-glucosyltransferase
MVTATIYSNHLLSRPLHWQEKYSMVGPILDEGVDNFVPSAHILDFLNKWNSEKVVHVGLGSMMSVMFGVEERREFLNNVQLAVENNNCRAVVSLVDFQITDASQISNTDKIFYLTEGSPHSWLFLNISAAVHHGGVGTTHVSLWYELPTLRLPFVDDQPFNRDRILINQLGPRLISIHQINAKNLTEVVHDLISDRFTIYEVNAKKMSESIQTEDGLGHCLRLVETELRT